MSMDPYKVLGVKPDATEAQIKKGYRKAAKRSHPDHGGKPEEFHKVQRSFALLMDKDKRADFDATGEIDEQGPMPEPMMILMDCFGQCLNMFIEGQLVNIKEGIRTGLQNAVTQTTLEIRKTQDKLSRLEKLVGKITYKGEGENYMDVQVNAIYHSYKQNLAKGFKREKEYQAALVLLPLFQFPDPPMPMGSLAWNMAVFEQDAPRLGGHRP